MSWTRVCNGHSSRLAGLSTSTITDRAGVCRVIVGNGQLEQGMEGIDQGGNRSRKE